MFTISLCQQTVATAHGVGGQSVRSTMKSPKSVNVGSLFSPSIGQLAHRSRADVQQRSHVCG